MRIDEAVYEGTFGTPKTEASRRSVPLFEAAIELMRQWEAHVKPTDPNALVFATRSGKPISPNNVLRRWVYPTCLTLGLPKVSWNVFRRTYSTWAHEKGVPAKIVARIVGHTKVDTTLNVYTQVIEDSVRAAVQGVGEELFTIVQSPKGTSALIH